MGIHIDAVVRTGRLCAALGKDFRLGGFHKPDAGNLADLAVKDVVHVVGVLLQVNPVRGPHQVIGYVGVDDAHKGAVNGLGVLGFQEAHRPENAVHRQLVGSGKSRTAGYGTVVILHVGAAV